MYADQPKTLNGLTGEVHHTDHVLQCNVLHKSFGSRHPGGCHFIHNSQLTLTQIQLQQNYRIAVVAPAGYWQITQVLLEERDRELKATTWSPEGVQIQWCICGICGVSEGQSLF